MTDLKVSGLEECWETETGQIVESAGVREQEAPDPGPVQCRLVIGDNVQASFQPGGSSPLVSLCCL